MYTNREVLSSFIFSLHIFICVVIWKYACLYYEDEEQEEEEEEEDFFIGDVFPFAFKLWFEEFK